MSEMRKSRTCQSALTVWPFSPTASVRLTRSPPFAPRSPPVRPLDQHPDQRQPPEPGDADPSHRGGRSERAGIHKQHPAYDQRGERGERVSLTEAIGGSYQYVEALRHFGEFCPLAGTVSSECPEMHVVSSRRWLITLPSGGLTVSAYSFPPAIAFLTFGCCNRTWRPRKPACWHGA